MSGLATTKESSFSHISSMVIGREGCSNLHYLSLYLCGHLLIQLGGIAVQVGLYGQCSAPMYSSSREMVSNFRSASASGHLLIRSCFISHLSPL